jgi:peptide/nickel transport system permease protein
VELEKGKKMVFYIFKRILWSVPILLGALMLITLLIDLLPGDPTDVLLGPLATEQQKLALKERLHLDKPLHVRYAVFVWNALHGDLGESVFDNRPVLEVVVEQLPHTIILGISSMFIAVLVGIPFGAFVAIREGSFIDNIFLAGSLATLSIPTFVVGILSLLVFSVHYNWFPLMGLGKGFWNSFHHLILPASTLATAWLGYISRIVRGTMIDVLSSDYIKTEKSFGAPSHYIWGKYALRNAIAPAVSTLGLALGKVLGGAVFVEIIFTRPGIGRLLAQSIEARNLPVVQGIILVTATLYVVANLLADLTYAYIDPRIRYE